MPRDTFLPISEVAHSWSYDSAGCYQLSSRQRRFPHTQGGSVAEWLACWTQWAWVQIAVATLSGNSLRQTVHTRRASVHQAAKLVTALLTIARVTAGLAESNDSQPPGL